MEQKNWKHPLTRLFELQHPAKACFRITIPSNRTVVYVLYNRNIEIVCSSVDVDNMVQLIVRVVCRSDVTDGVWTVDQYLRSGKCFDINLRIERRELSLTINI